MAKRIFSATTYTPTATADTTAMANGTYQAIKGGSSTQFIKLVEIYMGGQAPSVSSPCIMLFARSSTVATTPTALAAPNGDGPAHPSTAALAAVPVTFVAAAAGTQRSAVVADKLLTLSFNAYGGVVNWQAPQEDGPALLGNTQPLGEASLSAFTGGTVGLMGSHIMYEPL
jgi:hypothetical protein